MNVSICCEKEPSGGSDITNRGENRMREHCPYGGRGTGGGVMGTGGPPDFIAGSGCALGRTEVVTAEPTAKNC